MREDDELVRKFESLQPSRFYQIERFELKYPIVAPGEPLTSQLTIALRLDLRISYPQLVLSFSGVTQLRLDTSAFGSYGGINQLEVHSIRERQWDGLHYKIEDEEGMLTFYCDTFEAKIVEESKPSEQAPN